MSETAVRPTKKQRELLTFIEQFIGEHGYSPSYREVMNGLSYTSVATVSLHINSLIRRGHLRKRDRSARSLEVVNGGEEKAVIVQSVEPNPQKWLIDQIEQRCSQLESNTAEPTQEAAEELYVLVRSLRILGLHTAADGFQPRLERLSEQAA